MTMQEIIQADAEYMRDCTVRVETIFGHVTISTEGQDDIFLEGDEGSALISEARALWNELGNVTMQDCYEHLAKPYAENIWN